MLTHVTDTSFKEEVMNSDKPVLVDFWAAWCGPCKMIAPIVEQLSEKFNGDVKVVKMDVDANPVTSMTFQISSIPTLMLFDKGEAVNKFVGFRPLEQLEAAIKGSLNK
jgi:thioredoxin 1